MLLASAPGLIKGCARVNQSILERFRPRKPGRAVTGRGQPARHPGQLRGL